MFDPSWKSAMQTVGCGTCDGCKFWSERCAAQIGGQEMQALCLNPESHRYSKMVSGGCDKHTAGRSIDDPSPTASEISATIWDIQDELDEATERSAEIENDAQPERGDFE